MNKKENNNSELQLTELLYPLDELLITGVESILNKCIPIEECYYWFYELHISEIDIADIIRHITLIFYTSNDEWLEKYIEQKLEKYKKDKDFIHIATIVTNLRASKESARVLYMQQYLNELPTILYRSKEPLVRAIVQVDNRNIPSLITNISNRFGWDKVYKIIIDHYSSSMNCGDLKKIDNIWKNRQKGDDGIRLLSIICMFDKNKQRKKKERPIRVSAHKEKVKMVIEERNKPVERKYLYLSYKRRCFISNDVGAFMLARENVDNFEEACILKWEYYVRNTPSWKRRLKKFNITFNEDRSVMFKNDDIEDRFNQQYYMDLDEQPKEVQMMSLHSLNGMIGSEWIKKYIKTRDVNDEELKRLPKKLKHFAL